MIQNNFDFPLSELEEVTVKYFSEGKQPSQANIALAIKSCKVWTDNRAKLGLKPYK